MVLAPRQPIPHGRPYRYHLNGPVHMMTTRKRVGMLPTHRLVVRYLVDYSSLNHFASNDSSSSSSSKTSLDSPSDDLFDPSSDHSLLAPSLGMRHSHHLCSLVPSIPHSSAGISARPSHDSSSTSPSRKMSRSPAASVPLSSSIPGALSYVQGCLKDSFEPSRSRETDLEMDVDVAEIDECIAYADALKDRGIDARVVVEAVDRDEVDTIVRVPVKVRVDRVTHAVIVDDIPEHAQEEGAVEVTYETLGDLVHRFHDHIVEIPVHRV
nr:hypothetical protein [Tanacetum cinerariifolium]